MNSYNIAEELEKEIIKYCYDMVYTLNLGEISKKNKVHVNNFFECIFDSACMKQSIMGDYKLTKIELEQCFKDVRNAGLIMDTIIDGKNEIVGVRDNDILIFKQKIKIKKVKNDNNEVED